MAQLTGLLLVDKPAGPSSFGVLRSLRPALGAKLGHAGTLDPFATGLLLVLAGRATRLATYLSGLDKRYEAVVQFGAVSTTLDPEGEIEQTGGTTDAGAVAAAAAALTGEVLQAVPAASAVKIDGRRSYARMRAGETVAAPPRQVRIERIDVQDFEEDAQRVRIGVECSKGTYVRQIAADLGEATGAGAYCLELRRTAVGAFPVAAAGSPDDVRADPRGSWFRTPAEALPHLPARELGPSDDAAVRHGRALESHGETGPVRLVSGAELVAVGEPRDGRLRPVVVLG
ncbi:MAG TPA: tRNA pseudouridine(55) synthase TruB [Gaiellales bacterium]|jgi:tRNA pseudouridine55 synthase|nr:tRNA pseudouridine(55) synthase TruB [Gaiellales bacterium]